MNGSFTTQASAWVSCEAHTSRDTSNEVTPGVTTCFQNWSLKDEWLGVRNRAEKQEDYVCTSVCTGPCICGGESSMNFLLWLPAGYLRKHRS